ncbi:hypothetical protein AMTRI_Chr05g66680 [Amborella trichopoda]
MPIVCNLTSYAKLGRIYLIYRLPSRSLRSYSKACFSSASLYDTPMDMIKATTHLTSVAHERIAVRFEKRSHSYGQLFSSAWQISNLLQALKVTTTEKSFQSMQVAQGKGYLDGARVGIVAKPSAEFVASMLGTWLGGGVAVPLALSYPEAELFHVMNDSDVSVLLSTEDHGELMENVASKCSAHYSLIPCVPSNSSDSGVHEASGAVEVDSLTALWDHLKKTKAAKGDDPALIVYTSGTTGRPKGVVHTHDGIKAQVQILTEAWEYSSADQFLHCLPLHHIHHLRFVEFLPKFTVRGIWQRWRESYPRDGSKADDAITVFTGVPTMYTRLVQGYGGMDAESQAASAYAARQLRLMMCGSSALPLPVMKQWENVTGHCLLERYGMTEFGMALSNPYRSARKGGTVGKPLPYVQVKILAEEGSENAATAEGELAVKSPSLFKEYWNKPEVTKESFVDGFFKTGDSVTIDDDGYYIILGRTSADILKVGGYKLSALDIEAAILGHPDVAECCILGLPDQDYGEVVCAIVVPEAGAKAKADEESRPVMTLEQLQTWAKEKLAPYKIPTRLLLWESLPRNAMGKVNKKELKKLLDH